MTMALNIDIQLLAWINAKQLVGNENAYTIITAICTHIWWKDRHLSTGRENEYKFDYLIILYFCIYAC